ncbi:hypothetical protein POM88_053207 [Heracleum sosnowskyi]|uniref:AAA ATPase AAA+ lid domain-containing protein n=1 Tax=Heracleum sosnowskyi TaxID=360622 RepID=A0AAD8GQS9_9APIA|nr:hypothetical protein POM88_053207 [Heracleum sosnowskyi]
MLSRHKDPMFSTLDSTRIIRYFEIIGSQAIAATNSADILDPALMRSGRLDRKIEFPHPTEKARARILQIHSRKMNVHPDVNFEELARSTDDFNEAQLKAVCVEAGMLALRRDATEIIMVLFCLPVLWEFHLSFPDLLAGKAFRIFLAANYGFIKDTKEAAEFQIFLNFVDILVAAIVKFNDF